MLAIAGLNAMAFDSTAWFEKKRLHEREIARLKAAYGECLRKMVEPAENVTVPVEVFGDGAVRTLIKAEKAHFFLASGMIWGKGVKVIQYKKDRSVEFEITADTCVVDRLSKNGWAPGRAKGKYDGTNISGKGIYFSVYENYVKVYENTDVESRDVKFGEVKL
jgi:hypothetical protein